MRRPLRTALELLLLVAILALGAWLRLVNYPLVLVGGEVIPQVDGDSAYHLHRALLAVKQFPRLPHLDPLMDWPRGAFSPWPDGFDQGAAALAIAVGGRHDAERAALAIALWPVLLGVLLIWATCRLARVAAPGRRWRGGVLAAALLGACLLGMVVNSQIGRMDHHVVEMLVMVLLATWALRRIPLTPAGEAPPTAGFELEGALVSGLGVYGFTGTPLYVAIAAVPLARVAWRTGRVRGSGAIGLGLGAALAAALTVPAVLEHRMWWTFKYASFLQPLLLALVGVGLAFCAWAGGPDRAFRGRGRIRSGVAAAALAPLVALGLWLVAVEVRAWLLEWVLHRDPWLANVTEFRPYFRSLSGGQPWWVQVHDEFGWSGFTFPAFLIVLALFARTRRLRWLVFVTAVLLALALVQVRFARVLAPFLAVATGLGLALVLQRAGRRRVRPARAAWAALGLVALLALEHSRRWLLPPAAPSVLDPPVQAALDLRARPLRPGPARGVLSIWDYGHDLEALAGVPVAVNGFGSYLDAPGFWRATRVYQGNQAELDRYLETHRIGAVVAGAATFGREVVGTGGETGFAAGALDETFMKQFPLSPLLIAGSAIPGWDVAHLQHLMPRFASRRRAAGLRFALPQVWSYEVVPGARLRGMATPGARVIGTLPFTENHHPHTYKAWAQAGPDGSWELVVPFPGGYLAPNLRAPGPWSFSIERSPTVTVEVPEQAVRSGAVIDIGRLPAGAPGGTAPPAGDAASRPGNDGGG